MKNDKRTCTEILHLHIPHLWVSALGNSTYRRSLILL